MSRTIEAPFQVTTQTVEDAWIDYNGHMNVAYYVLLFDRGIDEAFEALGLGPDYRQAHDASFFAVEMHVRYLRELKAGAKVAATWQLLSADDKRVRSYMELRDAAEGFVAATSEHLHLHVDMTARRAAVFPPDIRANIEAAFEAHRKLPWPESAGAAITLDKR
ncbi:thioesterase family protein [Afifella marina]|uniref:Acyl-CoA thioester hydrolase n=1 Tax=Afifella marina DSM 2698 TaxID=1120955 RepID=A0A1G5N406_AFIMA|nr:thioesterase family protein [Afifella marina]MBK1622431.1 thioesterase [Afifella marina DSM 2698]MBK1626855.1 thioesterase [Afifella marina]MBK5919215.1 thioesterase [Afifella marina]RAI21258.1 thioesterase [Afifella marina DSM 2698]SCZ32082.1 acyl-CoA thioester hydrolase [Afifella marina DSM 2698]